MMGKNSALLIGRLPFMLWLAYILVLSMCVVITSIAIGILCLPQINTNKSRLGLQNGIGWQASESLLASRVRLFYLPFSGLHSLWSQPDYEPNPFFYPSMESSNCGWVLCDAKKMFQSTQIASGIYIEAIELGFPIRVISVVTKTKSESGEDPTPYLQTGAILQFTVKKNIISIYMIRFILILIIASCIVSVIWMSMRGALSVARRMRGLCPFCGYPADTQTCRRCSECGNWVIARR